MVLLLLACSTPAPVATIDPAAPPELVDVSESGPGPSAEWQFGPDAFTAEVDAGHPTLVYFFTDWCHYCKNLDRNVMHDPAVEAALTGVARVKVNPEKGSPASDLYRRFRGSYVPLLYLVTDHGRTQERVDTPDNADAAFMSGELRRVIRATCDRGAADACELVRG